MKRNLSFTILVLAAIFTLQSFDIPPIRNFFKPKTCCGRTVCLCKHAKGAICPFRAHHLKPAGTIKEIPASAAGAHKSCHLTGKVSEDHSVKAESQSSEKGLTFTKAPCHQDAPPSVLPGFSKDMLVTISGNFSNLPSGDFVAPALKPTCMLLLQQGIDHPPKALLLPVYF